MASNKRKPSKSMRQQRNRNQRRVNEARSAHAGEATAVSRGERQPVRSESTSSGTTTSSTATGAGSTSPKVDRGAARKAAIAKRYPIPGQRAIMMAFLFSIVTAATLLLTSLQFFDDLPANDPQTIEAADGNDDGTVIVSVPVDDPDADGVTDEDGDGEVDIEVPARDIRAISQELDTGDEEGTFRVPRQAKIYDEFSIGYASALLLTPIFITGIAFAATKNKRRSMIWTMSLLAFGAYIFFLATGIGTLALPSMIALAFGSFQSRKAETNARLAEIRANKEAGGGEVIDVDEAVGPDHDDGPDPDTDKNVAD